MLSIPSLAAAAPAPLAQMGSVGDGAGQLDQPRGIALDRVGNIYLAEVGNDRISAFAADGSFIHAFGWDVAPDAAPGDTTGDEFEVCTTICKEGVAGGGTGQLYLPPAVAVDGAGGLYVAENFVNSRISVFDAAGPSFSHAFGWDVGAGGGAFQVCTAASGCQAGSQGAAAGQLSQPEGIALDGAGNLFVTERFNNRISVFAADGSFIRAFGWDVAPDAAPGDTAGDEFEVCTTICKEGVAGGAAGQLDDPFGAAFDGAGRLHVADAANNRISVFNAAEPSFSHAFGWDVGAGGGAFQVCTAASGCQAGSGGDAAGQLSYPRDVALDSAGGAYVVGGLRVDVFNADGPAFRHAYGWGVDTGDSAFEVCTGASGCQAGSAGPGAGQLSGDGAVTTDCRGAVWVAAGNRVQRFGEPGTPLPPCLPVVSPALPAPSHTPSNHFTLGRVKVTKKGKKKGTATLLVTNIPGPGEVGLTGKGVRPIGPRGGLASTSKLVSGGTVKLRIKPAKKGKRAKNLKRRLKQRGRVKVKVEVTYIPTGGLPSTQKRRVKLVRERVVR